MHQNGVMWTVANVHPDDEFSRFSHMGWQSFASTEIEEVFFGTTVSIASRFDPQKFRVLLLRRLWCQLPLCSATCRCGQPLDSRGHHRGACAHAGVPGRRGFPLESCAARICRKAGARVSVNVRVQDVDLHPGPRADNRRLEVVADGLPLFHGAQVAVDTTMVSAS